MDFLMDKSQPVPKEVHQATRPPGHHAELINPLLSRQEMTGPAESPFEGGKFKLELFLPELKVKIM